MKITFKDIVWVAIVALIIIVLSRCHRDEKGRLSAEAIALAEEVRKTDSLYFVQKKVFEKVMIERLVQTQQALEQAKKAETKLEISEQTITRLSAAVKRSKTFPVDTSFITVPPEFVTYCDSLADETETLTLDLKRFKSINISLLAAKDQEIALRDTIIKNENSFRMQCQEQLADLQLAYGKAMDLAKERNQVYLGAEISGTQNTLLQNVGAVVSLKTKGNKLWQISSGLQYNGGLYARINGNILITFKR